MHIRLIGQIASISCLLANVAAAETFDFETPDQLTSSARVSGDTQNFAQTSEQANGGSTESIKFVNQGPEPFESWTYDMPFAITTGTVSVWFHDARGSGAFSPNPLNAHWGGSIILEDRNDPSDFGAVEICELPYGGGRYFGSEGGVDRQLAADKFDSAAFPLRAIGFHQVVFTIGATESTVSVDGAPSTQIGAPGGDKTLRLRLMCGAAGNGSAPPMTPGLPPGYQPNWFLTAPGSEIAPPTTLAWINYDDLEFAATSPVALAHDMGFEVISGTPEYDSVGIPFPLPAIPPHDDARMNDFVNQWDVSTSATLAHAGTGSGFFADATPRHKSVEISLAGAVAGAEVSLWFYDSLGPNAAQDKFGGSIILESGGNPADFLAVEIWNFPYPASMDPTPGGPNYYLTIGGPGSPNTGTFFSRVFGNRSVGWHEVVLTIGATGSTITVDGVGDPTKIGPGLNEGPKLRIMGDSATSGGFANWVGLGELEGNYVATLEPYVYYDDIVIPILNGVGEWAAYE